MFTKPLNVAVFGASGNIGKEFVNYFLNANQANKIFSFSRSKINFNNNRIIEKCISFDDENALGNAASSIKELLTLDIVIVASGILHENNIMPEKSLRDLTAHNFQRLFLINTIFPALIAKHFIPLMCRRSKSVFVILSAKVGSISENYLGGWYAYRTSKSALNMIIKNIALEVQRKSNATIVVGLHPGTVDSKLSRPFQTNVDRKKIFLPQYAVEKMLQVIKNLELSDSGKCWSWDGSEIKP